MSLMHLEWSDTAWQRESERGRGKEKEWWRERAGESALQTDEPVMERRNWKAQKQRTEQQTEIKGSQLKARRGERREIEEEGGE